MLIFTLVTPFLYCKQSAQQAFPYGYSDDKGENVLIVEPASEGNKMRAGRTFRRTIIAAVVTTTALILKPK